MLMALLCDLIDKGKLKNRDKTLERVGQYTLGGPPGNGRHDLVKGPFPARWNVRSIHFDDPGAGTIDAESEPAPGCASVIAGEEIGADKAIASMVSAPSRSSDPASFSMRVSKPS